MIGLSDRNAATRVLIIVSAVLLGQIPASLCASVIDADNHSLIAGTQHTNAIFDESTNLLWLDMTKME